MADRTHPVTARAVVIEGGKILSRCTSSGLTPIWTAARPSDLTYHTTSDDAPLGAITSDQHVDPADGDFVEIRNLAALPAAERRALAALAGMDNWHACHRFCATCGAYTDLTRQGRSRTCRANGHEEFVRYDPEVLVLITHKDDALLVHSPHWPGRMYSLVSGYLDSGETAEQAVGKEVAEETGLQVMEMRYITSEPWPYPHCLMLCFHATVTDRDWRPTPEVSDARWHSRTSLREALDRDELRLAAPNSPGHMLIRFWLLNEPIT